MKIDTVPAGSLNGDHLKCWLDIQRDNPELRSPFFHPQYAREAAAVFGNVEVAILEEGGEPAGFFAFQRTARNVGIPVGGSLNDFQGVVARPGFAFDAAELLRGCRLSGLRFTQLLASQQPFQPHVWFTEDSPSMDLSAGFENFCRQRRAAGSRLISQTQGKRRAAIHKLGPLRFADNTTDPRVLESWIAWKSRQYARIRAVNPLAKPGTLDFLHRLLALRGADFQGTLSAVYFGDRLAAVHLGMRCRNVLHVWFPTYNEELAKYSPGLIYLVQQAEIAASLGVDRIDLGCGDENFKLRLRNSGTQIAVGAVGLGMLANSFQRSWLGTKRWVQSSRFRGPARAVVRGIRGLFLYGLHHDFKSRRSS